MSAQTFNPAQPITLTRAAIEHMQREVERTDTASAVRIAIKPSGCSGYMYDMTLVSSAGAADDLVLQPSADLTVYIDRGSIELLQGTELDYVKEGLNATLQFRNPNATAECGCGESFSVTDAIAGGGSSQ